MASTESTTDVYLPLPGTIPYRALDLLAGSQDGSACAAVLANDLGQFVAAPDLQDILSPCIVHGLLTAERRSGLMFFDITAEGMAAAKRMKEQPRQDAPREKPARKVVAQPMSFTAPTDEPPAVEVAAIECALTSSGRLLIDANGMQMTLTPDQVRDLFIYTDRVRAGKGR